MIAARAIAVAVCVAASPAVAGDVYIVRPLPKEMVGALEVEAIEVSVSAAAQARMLPHEAKAAATAGADPARADYAALPFARMVPLVFADTMRDWKLTRGRPVTLLVSVLEFGTGNLGRAMLPGGTRDIVSGLVEVKDARGGATLGMFTVRVVNRHGGWTGMLIRGGGVREKLVAEFARDSARVLAGRKSITPKAERAAR